MAWQATPAAAAKAHLSNFNIHFLNFVHCQPDTGYILVIHFYDFILQIFSILSSHIF